jgi:hypothetical protein
MKRASQSLLAFLFVVALAGSAHAQATRTWVSGVGDDVNPCSRTAPCKTFAGAISKTATAGEISVLDPGGFGVLTINKSITVNGTAQISGILNAGTNGVIINCSACAVKLRNIDINGGGSGTNGIRILNARMVSLEGVNISGQRGSPGRGIDIAMTAPNAVDVNVNHCTIVDVASHAIANVAASGVPVVRLTVTNSSLKDNGGGSGDAIFLNAGTVATIANNDMTGFSAAGIEANNADVNADNNVITNCTRGIFSTGTGNVRLSRNLIVNNATAGFNANSGGTISSYGDNYFANNGANVGVLTNISSSKQ